MNSNKPSNPRKTAYAILLRVERDNAYADRLLAAGQVQELPALDRAFVRELVLGVLRWKLRLDHIIDICYNRRSQPLEVKIRTIVRIGLFQMIFMDTVPDWAAVNESVALVKAVHGGKASGLVNAILRRFGREGEPVIVSEDPVEQLSIIHSHQPWMVRRWIERWGVDTTEKIMDAGNRKHPVTVRMNRLRFSSETLAENLRTEGFETAFAAVPGYIIVQKGDRFFESQAFRDGWCTVQDAAAGMAVLLLDAEAGERILDLCAAPGGKTTQIAEITGDRARIDAVDLNPKRLALVKEAAERLGLCSITCIENDAVSFGKESGEVYDRVLLDAPCTGTGVLSKRPDMKWRRKPEDIERMSALQREMLHNAAGLVRRGGVIVYSTCTLEPEENENAVEWFLKNHDFYCEKDERFRDFEIPCGYLILPHVMNGTGAYSAKLRRK